jgi:DNA-binding NtrC family response regulator
MQGYLLSRPLPAVELEAALRATVRLPSPGRIEAASTLLLIDDEVEVLELLKMVLARDGYRILTATSAAAGFEVLALEEVHVIVCDQWMPVMGGTEFLGRVKELHPAPLRIMLTGSEDHDLVGTINQGEIYRFYTKPWNNDELRTRIRDAFRHYWRLNELDQGVPVPASAEAC